MEFEIDVSGKDILSKGYVICIANKNNIIKGFKFDEKLVNDLCSKFGQGFYRYKKSKKGKSMFKIRLYCVVIYFLFKSINYKELSKIHKFAKDLGLELSFNTYNDNLNFASDKNEQLQLNNNENNK